MTNFKLKSLAAPKSVSGSTLTTPDGFAMVAPVVLDLNGN